MLSENKARLGGSGSGVTGEKEKVGFVFLWSRAYHENAFKDTYIRSVRGVLRARARIPFFF